MIALFAATLAARADDGFLEGWMVPDRTLGWCVLLPDADSPWLTVAEMHDAVEAGVRAWEPLGITTVERSDCDGAELRFDLRPPDDPPGTSTVGHADPDAWSVETAGVPFDAGACQLDTLTSLATPRLGADALGDVTREPCDGIVDLQTLAAHEAGHALGLDHSCEDPGTATVDCDSVRDDLMFYALGVCERRVPGAWEEARIAELYDDTDDCPWGSDSTEDPGTVGHFASDDGAPDDPRGCHGGGTAAGLLLLLGGRRRRSSACRLTVGR